MPRLVLLPVGAIFPDGTGSVNAPAILEKFNSTVAQTANSPKVAAVRAAFDAAADEHLLWQFPVPPDYSSGGTVTVFWGSKGTTGNVAWKAGIRAVDLNSIDMDATTFQGVTVAAANTVPSVIGQVTATSISPDVTGLGAGEFCVLFVGRDADHASGDTSTSEAVLYAVTFDYD